MNTLKLLKLALLLFLSNSVLGDELKIMGRYIGTVADTEAQCFVNIYDGGFGTYVEAAFGSKENVILNERIPRSAFAYYNMAPAINLLIWEKLSDSFGRIRTIELRERRPTQMVVDYPDHDKMLTCIFTSKLSD